MNDALCPRCGKKQAYGEWKISLIGRMREIENDCQGCGYSKGAFQVRPSGSEFVFWKSVQNFFGIMSLNL